MTGVFDRLNSKLQSSGGEGLNPAQIAGLPPAQRKIVRLLLRELGLSYQAICERLASPTENDSLAVEEINTALDTLAKEHWLIRMGDANPTYEINLRHKSPSNLPISIWSALDSKIGESKP
jgi:hypothetical protein